MSPSRQTIGKADPTLNARRNEVSAEYRKLVRGSAADACETKGAEGVNFLSYMAAVMRLDAYMASQVEEVSPSRTIEAEAA